MKGSNALPVNNTSGVKGVSRDNSTGKWIAQISHTSKKRYLGRYDTVEKAIAVVEANTIEASKEFVTSNNAARLW